MGLTQRAVSLEELSKQTRQHPVPCTVTATTFMHSVQQFFKAKPCHTVIIEDTGVAFRSYETKMFLSGSSKGRFHTRGDSEPLLSILTRKSADAAESASQAVATDDLLKRLPHLLTPESVDQRVDHRVAHDEDEVHVKVRHEADAVEVPRAGDHEDEVQEKRSPADDEDPQQDCQRDGALHASPLVDGVASRQGGDALDMRTGQHEHVAVEGGHDDQHGEEHGHHADDDGGAVRVDDEDDPAARAEGPDSSDDAAGPPHCHDVVVPQSVEDGHVPAGGKTGVSPELL